MLYMVSIYIQYELKTCILKNLTEHKKLNLHLMCRKHENRNRNTYIGNRVGIKRIYVCGQCGQGWGWGKTRMKNVDGG